MVLYQLAGELEEMSTLAALDVQVCCLRHVFVQPQHFQSDPSHTVEPASWPQHVGIVFVKLFQLPRQFAKPPPVANNSLGVTEDTFFFQHFVNDFT